VNTNAAIEVRTAKAISTQSTVYLVQGPGPTYGYLDMEADATCAALYLGGVQQAAGRYGSTSSTADNKNNNYFSDTKVLTVLSGPVMGTVVLLR
jgi:hypothetical protein